MNQKPKKMVYAKNISKTICQWDNTNKFKIL